MSHKVPKPNAHLISEGWGAWGFGGSVVNTRLANTETTLGTLVLTVTEKSFVWPADFELCTPPLVSQGSARRVLGSFLQLSLAMESIGLS